MRCLYQDNNSCIFKGAVLRQYQPLSMLFPWEAPCSRDRSSFRIFCLPPNAFNHRSSMMCSLTGLLTVFLFCHLRNSSHITCFDAVTHP
ncbi:hypothetical protein ASPWEDRAFT_506323 [Aspergillus wentii DTO 134E9]|uniref:Uncharacterized protein n=1 Tax=Aspergillus wentii DTO 134E9 TaxID=1073089 RepID=A0A1L9RK69_ASPWE|nr:uncharacterized protein ASPWEDRAFT_506323 [Aspergillus wentii DTO 134E9]OJJ35336.1 hypothetical protein ASPWEDRAFT_506323 [Aspergillus wentii DTO 134E9]